jgi:glycyl-tRNA synthetase beta chain
VPELLLEIRCEEIPARMQKRGADDLKRLVCDGLKDAGLAFDEARAYVTPRRLILVVDGLPAQQPDVRDERKGPRTDAPDKAIQGFMRGAGLASIDEAEVRETDKGNVYFAVIERKGRPTAEVLADVLPSSLGGLSWPKSMRWGTGDQRWVRPLQGLVCVFGGAVVDFDFASVAAGTTTTGHRFLAPQPIAVTDFAGYAAKLRDAQVVIDADERRRMIADGAAKLAQEAGLVVKDDPGLLAEVTGLVEWPVLLMGTIDDAFMDVPPEVLTTAMRSHQKYFALEDGDGNLAPRFIVAANTEGSDGGGAIIAGNERVLRARLDDAKFFWDQDRKQTLESRVPDLAGRVFHAKLGSDLDKVDRMRRLAAALVEFVPGAEAEAVDRGVMLCKADLSTEMVGEFPELQGIMGRYYAFADGEEADVAAAIADHYSPAGPGDFCPTAPVSIVAALADKIDTLVGFWSIDEKPTGSKDPYALRRAALGVIRLIAENGLRLPLARVFAISADTHGASDRFDGDDLMAFFADRLKVHLREQGVRHDLISAVFSGGGEDDLVRLMARVEALSRFLDSDDGGNLLTAYKRAANIVRIEEKKDDTNHGDGVEVQALEQDEERTLFDSLDRAGGEISAALDGEDFAGAMKSLSRLRGPVDAFFDHVTVNADQVALRINRLRLLSRIREAMNQIADFSQIEGGER